jgi:protein-L-isoaspartate(D-aspartate) O-methyltransferase
VDISYSKVGPSGRAVGIDHIPDLVSESIVNIKKDRDLAALLESGQMKFVTGDGRQGYEEDGPYDAIHVGAAAATLPQAVSMGIRPHYLKL